MRAPSLTVLSALGLALAGCSAHASQGLDRSSYTLNVCTLHHWDELASVTLADPARYAELDVQSVQALGGATGPDAKKDVASHVGTACASATDPTTCAKTIADARATTGWSTYQCSGAGCTSFLSFVVTEKAGEVRVVTTEADLVALIAPIDTPADAALVAAYVLDLEGIDCSAPQVKANDDGSFEVFLAHGGGCNGDRQEHHVRVARDGTTTTVESATIPGDSSCPEQA